MQGKYFCRRPIGVPGAPGGPTRGRYGGTGDGGVGIGGGAGHGTSSGGRAGGFGTELIVGLPRQDRPAWSRAGRSRKVARGRGRPSWPTGRCGKIVASPFARPRTCARPLVGQGKGHPSRGGR